MTTTSLQSAIAAASGNLRALKRVRWVLRSGSAYVAAVDLETLETPLVGDRAKALVFDGRDNEVSRAAFFGALFGRPFVAELV